MRVRQCSRIEAGSRSHGRILSGHCRLWCRSSAEEWASGFHSSFAPLILSVLITWFPLTEHGRQTWIARQQAFTTMISFHFAVSLKMADLFSSHGCIMYVLFCEISEFTQALHAFVPQPQPCCAMQQLRRAESHAGHKSHLVSFKTSYWFATNYRMAIKKVLTCLLNG